VWVWIRVCACVCVQAVDLAVDEEEEEEEDVDELVAAELPPPLNDNTGGNSGSANGSSLEASNAVAPLVVRAPLSLSLTPRRAHVPVPSAGGEWRRRRASSATRVIGCVCVCGGCCARHEGGALLVHVRLHAHVRRAARK